MTPRRVGGLRKHPHGRVDQLEDRYLGMVEAPSSNLGTSTLDDVSMIRQRQWSPCAKTDSLRIASVFGSARPLLIPLRNFSGVDSAATNLQRSISVKFVGSAIPPFYSSNLISFCDTLGTSHGPNRLMFANRKRLDCRSHNVGFVASNYIADNGFRTTVNDSGRKPVPCRLTSLTHDKGPRSISRTGCRHGSKRHDEEQNDKPRQNDDNP